MRKVMIFLLKDVPDDAEASNFILDSRIPIYLNHNEMSKRRVGEQYNACRPADRCVEWNYN